MELLEGVLKILLYLELYYVSKELLYQHIRNQLLFTIMIQTKSFF